MIVFIIVVIRGKVDKHTGILREAMYQLTWTVQNNIRMYSY